MVAAAEKIKLSTNAFEEEISKLEEIKILGVKLSSGYSRKVKNSGRFKRRPVNVYIWDKFISRHKG